MKRYAWLLATGQFASSQGRNSPCLHDCPAWKGGPRLYGQDHAPLGTGDLDVAGLLDRLAAANYAGPVVFELRIEEALASLERVRALRPEML